MAADQYPEFFQAEPGHLEAGLHRQLTECLEEEGFSAAARATDHQVFATANPFQRAQCRLGWGGDRRETRVPGGEGLAGGNRRVCTTRGQCRAFTSNHLLAQENLDHL